MIKKRLFLALLFSFSLSLIAFGQEQKKKILVVPFSPYQFYSSFDLREISSINGFDNPDEVAQSIIDSLTQNLVKPNKKVSVIQIPENEYNSLSHLLNTVYKPDPVPHYGVNQTAIWQSESFQRLIKNYEIDYVLFLTQYVLEKKLLSTNRSFEGSFLIAWSNHLLQYEFYDVNGTMQVYSNGYELLPDSPKDETFKEKGLNLANMGRGYRSVRGDILKKMAQYELTGRPVYRLKKQKKKKKKKAKSN